MKKQLILICIIFSLASYAHAKEIETPEASVKPVRSSMMEGRTPVKEDSSASKSDEKMEKATGDAMSNDSQSQSGDKGMQKKMENEEDSDFAKTPDSVRQRITEIKDKFEKRIATIKDKSKRETASKLQDTFQKLNQRLSSFFLDSVDRLTSLTDDIEAQANIVKDSGKNIDDITALIKKARTAITALKTAATDQQTKVYDIKIQSDTTLRSDFKKKRQQFGADIQALRDAAQTARVAVRKAASALAEISPDKDMSSDDQQTEAPKPETTGKTNSDQ